MRHASRLQLAEATGGNEARAASTGSTSSPVEQIGAMLENRVIELVTIHALESQGVNEIASRSQARKTRIAGVGTRDLRRVSQ